MALFARSDVTAVIIPAEAGGCGETHSRPVVNGSPVKVWSLDCTKCHGVLKSDPLWSGTISEISETPDELAIREDQERRGQRDQEKATASALADLAKLGDLPAALSKLTEMMSGQSGGGVKCRQCGSPVMSSAKFCTECGTQNPGEPAVKARRTEDIALPDDSAAPARSDVPAGDSDGEPAASVSVEYSGLHVQKLKALARERGIDDSGTKADVLKRLERA